MKETKVFRLTMSALFAAIIFIATALFSFELPGGYAHLGDAFVILAGIMLGPISGALAAGIGGGLSDLFLGFVPYIPATVLIKALMAACAYAITRGSAGGRGHAAVRMAVASVTAELIMIVGYFLFETLFIYRGVGAAVNIVGNTLQGTVGAVGAVLFAGILEKTGIWRRFFRKF